MLFLLLFLLLLYENKNFFIICKIFNAIYSEIVYINKQ